MPWIAALALAVTLVAGCNQKDRSPAPAPNPAAPAAGSQAAPAAPTPAPAPAPTAGAPAAPTEPAGPAIATAEVIRRLTELADKACACPDRACVDATHAAHQQANAGMASRMRSPLAPAEVAAMQEQAARFSACLQKLP